MITTFRDSWKEHAPQFVLYMDRNYFDVIADRKHWTYCHREGVSAWTDDDSYIESWHTTVKGRFFKYQTAQHPDTVIHTLVHKVILHYQQRCIRHVYLASRKALAIKNKMSVQEIAQAYMDGKRAENPDVSLLVPTEDPNVFKIESFQAPLRIYNVTVDWTKGPADYIVSCSCPPFNKTNGRCKHMAVSAIELHNDWEQRNSTPVENLIEDDEAPIPLSRGEEMTIQIQQSIQTLHTILDRQDTSFEITHQEEVLGALRKAVELCEKHIPVLPEHSVSRKRQRV